MTGLASLPLCAQVDDQSRTARVKRVSDLLHSNQLVTARPLMQGLLIEVEPDMQSNLEFYIALSYVFEFYETDNASVLQSAAEGFKAFLSKYSQHELAGLARYNLADVHAMSRKYEDALKLYIPLYRNSINGVERTELLKKIVLIYVAEKKWEAGAPYFRDSMRLAKTREGRTTAAAYLLISQAKQGVVGESGQLLRFFKSPAPVFFTPRFNAALMEVGDQLQEEGELATASLFYQCVRSYENLEVGLSNYVANLVQTVEKRKGNAVLRNAYVEAKAELDNARADLAALQNSPNYTPLLQWRIASVYMEMGRLWEAFWRFRLMVDAYPDHEHAESILYSAYSLAYQMGHTEFAFELGKRYLDDPANTRYSGTVADQISNIYLEASDYDELYKLTTWYLARAPDDRAAQLLLFKHAVARLTQLENQELIRDFQEYRGKYGSSKCAVAIHYFLGMAYLLEQECDSAIEFLDKVIVDPNQRFRADASFRKAQAVLGLDNIEEARDLILEFIASYPEHPLRAEAELTLGNVVDMLGDVDTALEHYYLVEQYTEDRALLARAELKISRVLVDRRQVDAAIARLKSFIELYGETPESITVSAALANIYTTADQPRVALGVLKQAVDNFFKQTEIHQLDKLLVDYLRLDRDLRVMQASTNEFLALVKTDSALLKELIEDRAKQYRYFKEHDSIDVLVQESFVRDNEFRKAVLEDVSELDGLESQIEALNADIPVESADAFLEHALTDAHVHMNMPLVVRIRTALAKVETPELAPTTELLKLWDDQAQWPTLGAAGQLWILSEHAKANPAPVVEILEADRLYFINTPSELGFHLLQAQCYQHLGRIDESIESYRTLIKRFAQAKESGEASMQIGQMEVGRNNNEAARLELEGILHRNEWRGKMHAEALLWIGRSYVSEAKYAEAHGFFERIILGYPGFHEELAMAFYEDIQVLKLMGETASVQMTYDAYKLTPGLEDTEGAALIGKEFE